MGRTVALMAFVAAVFAAGVYCAVRPTVADGDVLAADLLEANAKTIQELHCDKAVVVGVDGARFHCMATFKDKTSGGLDFTMDREGMIHQASAQPPEKVKRTSDPWGD